MFCFRCSSLCFFVLLKLLLCTISVALLCVSLIFLSTSLYCYPVLLSASLFLFPFSFLASFSYLFVFFCNFFCKYPVIFLFSSFLCSIFFSLLFFVFSSDTSLITNSKIDQRNISCSSINDSPSCSILREISFLLFQLFEF